jgi:rRNA-processing protein CGR1
MGKIRKWKPAQTSRSSSTTAVPQLRSTWEQRLKQRSDRAAVQAAQRAVDETIRAQKRAEREEREAREKRKEENKEKGLQYQVITNTAKIKKMSKKQLRLIRKTDTTGVKPTKKQIAAAAKL